MKASIFADHGGASVLHIRAMGLSDGGELLIELAGGEVITMTADSWHSMTIYKQAEDYPARKPGQEDSSI